VSDDKAEAEIRRGRAAEQLLDNPLLREALAELPQSLFQQWRDTQQGQVVEREEIFRMLVAAKRFGGYLATLINDAAIAQERIDAENRDPARDLSIEEMQKRWDTADRLRPLPGSPL
jgi:hypothetical protein